MNTGDKIQLVIGTVALITLIILVWQTVIQNKLLRAQIIKDRFDMYKTALSPVSEDFLNMVADFPENWISRDMYDGFYKDHDIALRRYLYFAQLYEYFGMRYSSVKLRLPDPIGTDSLLWLRDLVAEREFLDVHRYYRAYYPGFALEVDSLLAAIQRNQVSDEDLVV